MGYDMKSFTVRFLPFFLSIYIRPATDIYGNSTKLCSHGALANLESLIS
jgi:hypothetical protein